MSILSFIFSLTTVFISPKRLSCSLPDGVDHCLLESSATKTQMNEICFFNVCACTAAQFPPHHFILWTPPNTTQMLIPLSRRKHSCIFAQPPEGGCEHIIYFHSWIPTDCPTATINPWDAKWDLRLSLLLFLLLFHEGGLGCFRCFKCFKCFKCCQLCVPNFQRSPLTDLTGQAVPKSPEWSCCSRTSKQGWIYSSVGWIYLSS